MNHMNAYARQNMGYREVLVDRMSALISCVFDVQLTETCLFGLYSIYRLSCVRVDSAMTPAFQVE